MLNYTKGGISWKEHDIRMEQVMARNREYFGSSEALAEVITELINDAAEKGWLKK